MFEKKKGMNGNKKEIKRGI